MKILTYLLLIFVAAPASAESGNTLRLFYCVHTEQVCVNPDDAAPTSPAKTAAIAKKALSTQEDFVGFIDAGDTTLQFFVESPDSILVDIPNPASKGSYQTHVTRTKALQIIERLSPPLLRYRSTLKLEFVRWQ